MPFQTIFFFILMSIGIAITPGPVMLLAFSNGANYGIRATIFGILGAGLGNTVLISLVAVTLDLLLRTYPTLFAYIQWFGIIYLSYMAVLFWISRPQSLTRQAEQFTVGTVKDNLGFKTFRQAFLIAATNPKGVLFFGSFFPQFISPDLSYSLQYTILTIIYVPLDMLCMGCYAYGGIFAARVLNEKGLIRLNRICALIMMTMAAMIVYVRLDLSSS